MALLQKNDLFFDYQWTTIARDDPRLTGHPDSTFLNREEGYEVLAFINRFAKAQAWQMQVSGLKLEWLIREHLPSNACSHAKVRIWTIQNWHVHDIAWGKRVARGDVH